MRVGWVHAPHQILHRVNLAKQGSDLCTSTFAQLLALRFLQHRRRDEVLDRMREAVPLAGATRWSRAHRDVAARRRASRVPAGGLFLWATLADGLDTTDLLAAALERDVAFVPGVAAYADGRQGASSMRLNFSACDEERIAEGIARIGGVVRERADAGPRPRPAPDALMRSPCSPAGARSSAPSRSAAAHASSSRCGGSATTR